MPIDWAADVFSPLCLLSPTSVQPISARVEGVFEENIIDIES